MRLSIFINHIGDRKISVLPPLCPDNDPYNGPPWEFWEELAELTQYVDYDCQFINGICKRERGRKLPEKACCCRECYSGIGFIYRLPYLKRLVEIAPYFHKKIGFWKEGIGCTLPRKWRSKTCLGFNCGIPYYTYLKGEVGKPSMDALLLALLNNSIYTQEGYDRINPLLVINGFDTKTYSFKNDVIRDFIKVYKKEYVLPK